MRAFTTALFASWIVVSAEATSNSRPDGGFCSEACSGSSVREDRRVD